MVAMTVEAITETFRDLRGDERYLRATCHADAGSVVLSMWRDTACAGTFRLSVDDVPDLIALLRRGLKDAYDEARSPEAEVAAAAQVPQQREAHASEWHAGPTEWDRCETVQFNPDPLAG